MTSVLHEVILHVNVGLQLDIMNSVVVHIVLVLVIMTSVVENINLVVVRVDFALFGFHNKARMTFGDNLMK